MGNLNNAINAVSDKEAVQFKTAIINELSRRLYNALEESRSSVANETFNNTEDMHFVEEDNIEEQITNEAVVDYKYMNGKLHKRIDKKFWKPETRNMEFKKVGSTTYYRIDKASWLPLRKGMNFIESTEVEGDDIQEKVDIDGRTSMYRNTVARIEQARKMRTEKTNKSSTEIEEDNEKFDGLYDDGTGRGARIPKPLDINPNRFAHITKESVDINEYDEAVMMKGGKYTMKEEELSPKQKEYRKFFDAALNKFKAKSPADLDDAKKKEFFNYVKQNWKG